MFKPGIFALFKSKILCLDFTLKLLPDFILIFAFCACFCNPKIQSREVSLHEHVLGSSNCDHGGDASLLLNGNQSHQSNSNNCSNGFSSQSNNQNHSSSNSHQLPSLFIDSVLEPASWGSVFTLDRAPSSSPSNDQQWAWSTNDQQWAWSTNDQQWPWSTIEPPPNEWP